MKTIVDKIGFEYEMAEKDYIENTENYRRTYDGSIRSDEYNCVEIISKPFDASSEIKKLKSVLKYLTEQAGEINKSMGFHIHVSLKNDSYSIFCSDDFIAFVKKKIMEYAEKKRDKTLKERFYNNFCRGDITEAHIDKQIAATNKTYCRYYFINFAKSFHNTIEFRIFPARRSFKTLWGYIRLVLEIFDEYYKNKTYCFVFGEVFNDEEEENNEVIQICVD